LEEMCQAELDVLDTCLGQDGDDCNAANVECAEQGSSMFTLPKPLIGAPVSDACRRVADTQGMLGVVDRYEKTTHACIQAWPGWDESFTVSVAFKSDPAHGGESTLSSSASESTENAIPKQDMNPPAEDLPEPPAEESFVVTEMSESTGTDSGGNTGFTMFMYGVGSGLALVGVALALTSMRRKGQGSRRGFNSVEMVESDLVMM
jgi:hypothetical protein